MNGVTALGIVAPECDLTPGLSWAMWSTNMNEYVIAVAELADGRVYICTYCGVMGHGR